MIPRFVQFPAILLLLAGTAVALDLRDVTYSTRDAGRVIFSHNRHIRQQGIANDCKVCHNAIFDMRQKRPATMADMTAGRSCGACHNGTKAFPLAQCVRCHPVKEIVYRVRATGPTRFGHTTHLRRNGDCTDCHPALFAAGANPRATMADMTKGRSCGACHDGSRAFPLSHCDRCHPFRDRVYRIKGAGNVTFSHNAHLTAVPDCKGCHPRLFHLKRGKKPVPMAAMAAGKSCGACHNGRQTFSVQANCARCHRVG